MNLNPLTWFKKPEAVATYSVEDLEASGLGWVSEAFDGDKFEGGFGDTKILEMDYWTLRTRSRQLFHGNLYARGIVRRLVTNEINTGLTLEATPENDILDLGDDFLGDWSDMTETRFGLWAKTPELCDFKKMRTIAKIQKEARIEALVSGDILIVMHPNKETGFPAIETISGGAVQTPFEYEPPAGVRVIDGVEMNERGEHLAFHVLQDDLSSKRVPAKGAKTGRRIAWLFNGTDKLQTESRAAPLLSIILQSLREIDRYRDSAQRKAVLNAMLAMFIKKTQPTVGTNPISGAGVRRKGGPSPTSPDTAKPPNVQLGQAGIIMEALAEGEEPVAFGGQGTDVNFSVFEAAIINGIAWGYEIPPEILTLSFQNNYSASQAAINEFKMYLNMVRAAIGTALMQPMYVDFLISDALRGQIAPGFLAAWRDRRDLMAFAAWVQSDWSAAIKPSTDILKQAKGYLMMRNEGWITNARVSRELTGTKFTRNLKTLAREMPLLMAAFKPVRDAEAENSPQLSGDMKALATDVSTLIDALEDTKIDGEN